MNSAIIHDLVPWFLLLVALAIGVRLLAWAAGGKWQPARILRLHRDQTGAVQSLAFVLTVPILIIFLMLIVQVSQIMLAVVNVHYAAFAAARAAIVWIPADTGGDEAENRISTYVADPTADIPGPGTTYTIQAGGDKYRKIEAAAVLACAAISPSRDVGYSTGGRQLDSLRRVYRAMDPNSQWNRRISPRLANKLAYSRANTKIKVGFLHRDDEPPLRVWEIPPDINEFYYNEVGWQDPIKVTVTHHFALLPGPGRLLATSTGSGDTVATSLKRQGRVFTREISASVTLPNEGLKSVLKYRHDLRGGSRAGDPPPPAEVPEYMIEGADTPLPISGYGQ
jgi:hypothetical protein